MAQQQQQALLGQQGIEQAGQQQTFENIRALQQAQLAPFLASLGQAGAGGLAAGASGANIASQRLAGAQQSMAGAGAFAGQSLNAIAQLFQRRPQQQGDRDAWLALRDRPCRLLLHGGDDVTLLLT